MKQLNDLLNSVKNYWPDHENFLNRSISSRSEELLLFSDDLSGEILKLIDKDLDLYLEGYKWTCEMLTQEEIYFRRNEEYRYKTLNEVSKHVYENNSFMSKYVRGLLLSQVLWKNHTNTFKKLDDLLKKIKPSSVLEIGPGHGLLLSLCAKNCVHDLHGLDISESSLNEARRNFEILCPDATLSLTQADALKSESLDVFKEKVDLIILSEVLEHIQFPTKVLENLKPQLKSTSKVFINVPINCPAPDHIYFMDSKNSAIKMVEKSGLRINSVELYPATGYSIEQAVKRKLTISVCIVASL